MSEIEQLRDLVEVQGRHGTWNYDPYMQGMFNGMELALATMEGREPNYRSAPEQWLADISVKDMGAATEGASQ